MMSSTGKSSIPTTLTDEHRRLKPRMRVLQVGRCHSSSEALEKISARFSTVTAAVRASVDASFASHHSQVQSPCRAATSSSRVRSHQHSRCSLSAALRSSAKPEVYSITALRSRASSAFHSLSDAKTRGHCCATATSSRSKTIESRSTNELIPRRENELRLVVVVLGLVRICVIRFVWLVRWKRRAETGVDSFSQVFADLEEWQPLLGDM